VADQDGRLDDIETSTKARSAEVKKERAEVPTPYM
jgi:hypothetical protein